MHTAGGEQRLEPGSPRTPELDTARPCCPAFFLSYRMCGPREPQSRPFAGKPSDVRPAGIETKRPSGVFSTVCLAHQGTHTRNRRDVSRD